MNKEALVIPAALQIHLDDIGWMYGEDQRTEGKPSRTGMPRKHVVADYEALNEIGRALNMKIATAMVIGEWDTAGVLRNVPNSSWMGKAWNGSPYFDAREAEKIRDYLNACEYVEIGLHGLLHEFWQDGALIDGNQEYYEQIVTEEGKKRRLFPEDYLRSHFDAFYEIYNRWGFTQKITSFASPGGCDKISWTNSDLTHILKDYGIRIWCNFQIMGSDVHDGVIVAKKDILLAPWEAYDLNPAHFQDFNPDTAGIVGGHWPNLLRFHPEDNLERVDAWKQFFARQAEMFGMMLSRDLEFACYQMLFKRNSVITEENGNVRIDLSKADAQLPEAKNHPLYIAVKNQQNQPKCIGGIISEYEVHRDFKIYKIEARQGSVITIC